VGTDSLSNRGGQVEKPFFQLKKKLKDISKMFQVHFEGSSTLEFKYLHAKFLLFCNKNLLQKRMFFNGKTIFLKKVFIGK
jgi:hypothetical protein